MRIIDSFDKSSRNFDIVLKVICVLTFALALIAAPILFISFLCTSDDDYLIYSLSLLGGAFVDILLLVFAEILTQLKMINKKLSVHDNNIENK